MILNFDSDLMWFLWLGPLCISIGMILYVQLKRK